MKRILVYSSGAVSLADIHRLLAVAVEQRAHLTSASVLVISGSSVREGFRLEPGIYRVHLPTVQEDGGRADLIRSAVQEFGPDAIVVDTTPLGVENELESMLSYAKEHLPATSLVLVLRETPHAATAGKAGCTSDAAVDRIYDRVLTMQ